VDLYNIVDTMDARRARVKVQS